MSSPTPLRLTIGDARAVVAGLSPDLATRLRDVLRPFAAGMHETRDRREAAVRIEVHEAQDEQQGTRWIVRLGDEDLCGHARADDLLQYLEWLAISQALAATRRYAVFHAGALAREASAVMLVGPSGAGKSTLTLNLIRRGWQPLSDDMTLVDLATGAIHPFPRCFHVDPARMARETETETDDGRFAWPVGGIAGFARPLRWAAGGQRVTTIFEVARDPQGRSTHAPMTQAQGAGILLSQALMTALAPAEVARAAVGVAGGARCYHLTNGDLEGALDLITACARDTEAPGARGSPARRRRPAGSAPARSTHAP